MAEFKVTSAAALSRVLSDLYWLFRDSNALCYCQLMTCQELLDIATLMKQQLVWFEGLWNVVKGYLQDVANSMIMHLNMQSICTSICTILMRACWLQDLERVYHCLPYR
jgi:hypothetical protein